MKKINKLIIKKFVNKNKVNSVILMVLVLSLAINLSMCKTASSLEDDSSQFTLSVNIANGVNGTPVSGTTLHTKNETVSYNYQLQDGFNNLIVLLDGTQVASSGTITMDRDHNLKVSSSPENATEYTLSVNVGSGVTGTPSTETHTYSENEIVSYSYQAADGYRNLVVSLDGKAIAASGNITMDKDHNLEALAEPGYDITGEWDLKLEVNNVSAGASILEIINVNLEFSGTVNSGSVFINGKNVGSYSVQNETISFLYNIIDPVLGQLKYEYTGKFVSNDSMEGDVTVYKITAVINGVDVPMAEVVVKRGKWSGKRKKK